MRAADGAGDRPLAAQAISSLAYLTANSDDPRTAVVLARSAYEGACGTATQNGFVDTRASVPPQGATSGRERTLTKCTDTNPAAAHCSPHCPMRPR